MRVTRTAGGLEIESFNRVCGAKNRRAILKTIEAWKTSDRWYPDSHNGILVVTTYEILD